MTTSRKRTLLFLFIFLLVLYVVLRPDPRVDPHGWYFVCVELAEAALDPGAPIAKALDSFHGQMGRYPCTEEGLAVLAKRQHPDTRFRGPYLSGEALVDPWGSPFSYRCPGMHHTATYDLWSWGPDRRDDEGRAEGDDVTNWGHP